MAQLCQREVKKLAQKSQRASKDMTVQPRARRLMREALIYWRRYERVEKEAKKKAEREALEQRKAEDEMREVRDGMASILCFFVGCRHACTCTCMCRSWHTVCMYMYIGVRGEILEGIPWLFGRHTIPQLVP